MRHIATVNEWTLFDVTQTTGEMLRVAYNLETSGWHHVCDSLNFRWDPDPMIPQNVIDIHLNTITRKVPS